MNSSVLRARLSRALPAATVLSLTAAATMSVALPAGAAPQRGGAPGTPDKTTHPAQPKVHDTSATPAVEGGVVAGFGAGKFPIDKTGLYPTDQANTTFPDLHLEVVYQNDGLQTAPCDYMESSPGVTDYTQCGTEVLIPNGSAYTVQVVAGSSVPDGWLLPKSISGVWDTTGANCTPLGGGGRPAIRRHLVGHPALQSLVVCTGPPVLVPGTWRQIGITVSDKATDQPVDGASYQLYPGSNGPAGGESRGSTRATPAISTGTSSGSGQITFSGLHLGGTYSVVQTSNPKGFAPDTKVHVLHVPSLSYNNLGQAYNAAIQIAPKPPVLANDKSGGAFGKTQVIKVLANDAAAGSPPLTLLSATSAKHGTVTTRPNGTVAYTPANGFSGTDTFTYKAKNAFGGRGVATVTVVVHPKVEVKGEGAQLPFTGSRVSVESKAGIGTIVLGLLLTGLGLRRRRDY